MELKVYADRMSQPSRAVIIFCKVNGINFEEIKVDLSKRQHLSAEFKEINPMRQVPTIVDGRFKLFESHAILIYLASAFPGVADHWYPADVTRRAKIHSVLDWHHSNLRRGAATFILHTVLGAALGLPMKPQVAAEAEKILSSSLSKIESIWLKGNGRFLVGGLQPSIADLSLVCEIMQLEGKIPSHLFLSLHNQFPPKSLTFSAQSATYLARGGLGPRWLSGSLLVALQHREKLRPLVCRGLDSSVIDDAA